MKSLGTGRHSASQHVHVQAAFEVKMRLLRSKARCVLTTAKLCSFTRLSVSPVYESMHTMASYLQ